MPAASGRGRGRRQVARRAEHGQAVPEVQHALQGLQLLNAQTLNPRGNIQSCNNSKHLPRGLLAASGGERGRRQVARRAEHGQAVPELQRALHRLQLLHALSRSLQRVPDHNELPVCMTRTPWLPNAYDDITACCVSWRSAAPNLPYPSSWPQTQCAWHLSGAGVLSGAVMQVRPQPQHATWGLPPNTQPMQACTSVTLCCKHGVASRARQHRRLDMDA